MEIHPGWWFRASREDQRELAIGHAGLMPLQPWEFAGVPVPPLIPEPFDDPKRGVARWEMEVNIPHVPALRNRVERLVGQAFYNMTALFGCLDHHPPHDANHLVTPGPVLFLILLEHSQERTGACADWYRLQRCDGKGRHARSAESCE